MGIFRQPLDVPPGPKGKHNATREADTIRALGESRTILQRLVNLLSPFAPTGILDATGRRFICLAFEAGTGEVAETLGIRPFTLLDASDGAPKIRVIGSTIGAASPTGFSPGDDPPYILTLGGATGVIYGGVTIDTATGFITSWFVGQDASLPADDDETFHFQIGSWATTGGGAIVPHNDRYGPVHVQVCRDWFASAVPYFSVVFP